MEKHQSTIQNIIIVGGGPAGLAAAIYAGRAGLDPLVIEGVPSGGQLMLTTEVENYPGFAKGIQGPELIAQFREQAKRFDTKFIQENVIGIEPAENKTNKTPRTYRIKTDKQTFQAHSVLLATGADAIWMGLDSEQRLRGRGVSACATCDGFFFRDKTVAVIGGGDSAMEEALTLTTFAKKVYVIHRRSAFRASKIMADRVLKHEKIEVIWNTTVSEVIGDEKVEGIRLQSVDSVSPKREVLKLDGIFVAIGHKPATDFLRDSAVVLDKKGYIVTSSQEALRYARSSKGNGSSTDLNFNFEYASATCLTGVFAAGDCVDHTYRQAATAVGMGVAAELEIERYLNEIF
ncbi:MAG: FAD-dependent oxidoreductase [Candidatus Roizmanbacteria bacterium]|nr:FAD-dependent oxidoreductase [Candidatus Roizmanbacteria bacterium]